MNQPCPVFDQPISVDSRIPPESLLLDDRIRTFRADGKRRWEANNGESISQEWSGDSFRNGGEPRDDPHGIQS
jgi:hypothetical protein